MQDVPLPGTSLLKQNNFLVHPGSLTQVSHAETQAPKQEKELLQKPTVFYPDHLGYFALNAIPETGRVEVQEALNADFQAPCYEDAKVDQDPIGNDQMGANPEDVNKDQKAHLQMYPGFVSDNPEAHVIYLDYGNNATPENSSPTLACQEVVIETDEVSALKNPEAGSIETSKVDLAKTDSVGMDDLKAEAQDSKSNAGKKPLAAGEEYLVEFEVKYHEQGGAANIEVLDPPMTKSNSVFISNQIEEGLSYVAPSPFHDLKYMSNYLDNVPAVYFEKRPSRS